MVEAGDRKKRSRVGPEQGYKTLGNSTVSETGGAISDAFSTDSGPEALSDVPQDVADLARRLATLSPEVRAVLLAAVKVAQVNAQVWP